MHPRRVRRRPLDAKLPLATSRGERAFRTVCRAFGYTRSDIPHLRGVEAERFHRAWTARMRTLARREDPNWDPLWDDPHERPASRRHHSTTTDWQETAPSTTDDNHDEPACLRSA